MTGHGRGECAQSGYKVAVEVSSVNRKQSEITVHLPRELEILEAQVRDAVNQVVARGRLAVRVTLHTADNAAGGQVRVNTALAKAYAVELKKLSLELKLKDAVTLENLLRCPGVLQAEGGLEEAEALWPAMEKALQGALAGLCKMREREGANLAKDLSARIKLIQQAWTRVKKHAPEVQVRYREQLLQRIKMAGLETVAADDERLLKEVVLFADRSDITEEVTRLQSHFQQFADCLKAKEPVGRTLDFLAQEINREINTIGSKANDAVIAREVVTMKTELERFREQVQNVE